MTDTADWQFDLEVHPPGWAFPAGKSWVAGWLFLKQGRLVTDLRAWIDTRPCLAIHGLPKPGLDEQLLGRPAPPYSGFILLLTPQRGATWLRLEVRDADGNWREFFRTPITVAADAPAAPPLASLPLSDRLVELMPRLLRRRTLQPMAAFATLADDVVSAALAEPLDALPNPPFHGALEEPRAMGWLRYGRILITGWLAHRTAKIRRITALIDATHEVPLFFGRARPDIASVFADLPRNAQVQFVGHVDLPAAQRSGPALVKIFAELESGEKHLAFAQRFTPQVIAGADTPLPARSRLTFASALWALRGATRQHGLLLGSSGALLASAREAWSAYCAEAPDPSHHRRSTLATSSSTAASAPRRILVVTHNLNFEGAPRLIFELAGYLHGQPGSSVRVLSPQEGPMRRLFEEAGMPVEIVDLSGALTAPTPAAFHLALQAAIPLDWSGIDLVVANTMVSFWAVHLAAAARKPSLLYIHESSPIRRFFVPLLPAGLFPLVETAFRTATRVVFTADASRRVFDYLNDREHFRVRPSWLDLAAIDAFAATQSRAALRAKHGIDPDALVILNLGTVCERKGQHIFITAAALLETELRAAHFGRTVAFVMVGARDDDFVALLRLQVAAAGLQSVRFVAETSENFDWLRLADLLVCTSFEESSPRVIIEAAAFGLPIVSTNVNGIPELVTEEEAWLIEPGDPRQLAAALRSAIAAHAAHDLSRPTHARRTALARFDARVSLPQHLALANEAAATYP
ncbi:MAG: glycosyltransferase family 4 protein [Opitutaceae bacterium]|nr:glycosyltransferase family 4 protein [Opitutaceae bacterium]MBP9912179.1 glycosyltransferase family 4 protein [Opitutaceae bacterium]